MSETKHTPTKEQMAEKRKLLFAMFEADPKIGFKKANEQLKAKGLPMSKETFQKLRKEWNEKHGKQPGAQPIPAGHPLKPQKAAKASPANGKSVIQAIQGNQTPVSNVVHLVRDLLSRVTKQDAHKLIDDLS